MRVNSQEPTDLDLHCLQWQGISGFSSTKVNIVIRVNINEIYCRWAQPNYIYIYIYIASNNFVVHAKNAQTMTKPQSHDSNSIGLTGSKKNVHWFLACC